MRIEGIMVVRKEKNLWRKERTTRRGNKTIAIHSLNFISLNFTV